ncbi:hypothetical protein [Geomonas agri]|uniref:hypothetical protein n=1 Tax=Geomonas agri TaxID=2873702 RepID=UPI001CD2E661|nr:hypothetical protein [Geomonas agri]
MAQINFKFQKRQKELDRKKKQEEKALRKQDKTGQTLEDEADQQDALTGAVEP